MPDLPENNMQVAVVMKHQEAIDTLLKQIERSAAEKASVTAGWKAAVTSQEKYRLDIINLVYSLRKIQKSRDNIDTRCNKVLEELDRITEQRHADARRIVATVVAEEREQGAAAEIEQGQQRMWSPPRWSYAFAFVLALLILYVVSRKVNFLTL